MRKTMKALALVGIATAAGTGVVLATPDFLHPNGVGTAQGVLIGPDVDAGDTSAADTVAFTSDGAIRAVGDLEVTGAGGAGMLSVTDEETLLAGLTAGTWMTSWDDENLLSLLYCGRNGEGGITGGWVGTGQYFQILDSSVDTPCATVNNGAGSVLTLIGATAALRNDAGAALETDTDGNLILSSGPDGDVVVNLCSELESMAAQGGGQSAARQESLQAEESFSSELSAREDLAQEALQKLGDAIAPLQSTDR